MSLIIPSIAYNPEGGKFIVFDFNKPKIEITEISEDKNLEDSL